MKKIVRVLILFNLQSNLRLTRGILVILAETGTSGALMLEWVVPHHSVCSRSPMKTKNYFGIFRGSACKLRADKIRYQHPCVRSKAYPMTLQGLL